MAHIFGILRSVPQSDQTSSVRVAYLAQFEFEFLTRVPVQTSVDLLPPATKLGQGYVFTRVCDSVHMGVSLAGGLPHGMLAYPPLARRHPLARQTPLAR